MQDGFFRGRSPLGLRGLKWLQPCVNSDCPSRSPLGLRGLKSVEFALKNGFIIVAAHSGCVD